MPTIKDEGELKRILEKEAESAIEDASKEVLQILKKDYILKYAYTKSPKVYRRTMEFLDSFDWGEIKSSINTLTREMSYRSENLPSYDPEKFVHGSFIGNPNDARENLADILNKTGFSSSLWISVERKRAYWDEFINEMFSGGRLEKILRKHFLNHGFSVV